MHNWFAMEVEAESRRLEWEREVAAEARAALACAHAAKTGWFRLPHLSLMGLRRSLTPRLAAPPAVRHAAPARTH